MKKIIAFIALSFSFLFSKQSKADSDTTNVTVSNNNEVISVHGSGEEFFLNTVNPDTELPFDLTPNPSVFHS